METNTNPLDITKPLRRRDGGEFEVWKKDGEKIHGIMRETSSGGWHGCSWKATGQYHDYGLCEIDLLPAPRRIKGWIAIYANSCTTALYQTKQEALSFAGNWTPTCIYIDVEEGEGL